MALILAAFFLATLPRANADEQESAGRIAVKQEEVKTGHFRGITYFCKSEESEEIETTPGGVPLVVDDPGTPGCKNWEINLVADGDLTKAANVYELPLLDLNYGVGDNVQLKYEVPNTVVNSDQGRSTQIGDSLVGIKYRFYEDEDSAFQIGTYPQIQFFNPALGSASDASDRRGSITILPLLMSKRIGRTSRGNVMLTANVGYNSSTRPDVQNFVSSGVGLGAPLIGKAAIVGEVVIQQATKQVDEENRQELVRANIGLIGPVAKHLVLFASVGGSLASSDHLDHRYFVSGFRVITGD